MKIPEHFRPPIIILLILLCFFCVIIAIAAVAGIHERPYSRPYLLTPNKYTVDPETLLKQIDTRSGDVFLLSHEKEEIGPQPPASSQKFPSGTFEWTQSDYLKIAEAHHSFIHDESLDNWFLHRNAVFGIDDCKTEFSGFDYAQLIFFQEENEFYKSFAIKIYPLYEAIYSGGDIYEHYSYDDWIGIDIANLNITADDALKIADIAGGNYARETATNDCDIVVITRGITFDVVYWSKDNNNRSFVMFEASVNSKTGKYDIVVPSDK